MLPSKTLLLFTLTILASFALNAPPVCLHTAGGYVFNLCPFKNSFYVNYNILPVFEANVTFSFYDATIPNCNNSNPNSWLTATDNYGECANQVVTSPSFDYIHQLDQLQGLRIVYTTEDEQGLFVVNLYCNQSAPHDTNVNWFVEGFIDVNFTMYGCFTMSGYSYYGCPVKANGRKFLQFDD